MPESAPVKNSDPHTNLAGWYGYIKRICPCCSWSLSRITGWFNR